METKPQPGVVNGAPATLETYLPAWAEQVRMVLRESGAQPLAYLARKVPHTTTNEVAMAIGWLAHAGDIRFSRREELWMIEHSNHSATRVREVTTDTPYADQL